MPLPLASLPRWYFESPTMTKDPKFGAHPEVQSRANTEALTATLTDAAGHSKTTRWTDQAPDKASKPTEEVLRRAHVTKECIYFQGTRASLS